MEYIQDNKNIKINQQRKCKNLSNILQKIMQKNYPFKK